LNSFPNELFTYSWRNKQKTICAGNNYYPYLLVNIGSGVSIVRVEDGQNFKRISGSSIGGGTFWALAQVLTGVNSFAEIVSMSDSGDNKNIDLLVGDIYGGDYKEINLPSYVIAANLGKMVSNKNLNKNDIIKSLLYMVADNITQIAYLNCTKDIKHILFTGSFLNAGPCLWKKISFGTEFWSQGKVEAKFFEHCSYLGALGSILSYKN